MSWYDFPSSKNELWLGWTILFPRGMIADSQRFLWISKLTQVWYHGAFSYNTNVWVTVTMGLEKKRRSALKIETVCNLRRYEEFFFALLRRYVAKANFQVLDCVFMYFQ